MHYKNTRPILKYVVFEAWKHPNTRRISHFYWSLFNLLMKHGGSQTCVCHHSVSAAALPQPALSFYAEFASDNDAINNNNHPLLMRSRSEEL